MGLDVRALSWRVRDLRLGRTLWAQDVTSSPVTSVLEVSNIVAPSIIAGSDGRAVVESVAWRFADEVTPPTSVRADVVGRRLNAELRRVDVDLAIYVEGPSGPLATGQCTLQTALDDAEMAAIVERTPHPFNGEGWSGSIIDELATDETFAAVTNSFDGSIAVSFGVTTLALRLYRGRLIDRGLHLKSGATFSVGATPATWLDFARRPRNEFISFAMGGRFEVRGSTYEYLRMTNAVMTITNVVRRRLGEELRADA